MIDLGSFTATAVLPFDGSAATWINPGPQTALIAVASADVCLCFGAEATTGDFKLLAGCYVRLRADEGKIIGFIAADAAQPGELRLTRAGEC